MDELTKQIISLIGNKKPRAVFRKRSYIIAKEEGKDPLMQRCHVFILTDENGTERDAACITVTTNSDANRVCDILRNRYGMERYPRGRADPSWLVEVWV